MTGLLDGDSNSQEIKIPFESRSDEHVTRNSRTASPGGSPHAAWKLSLNSSHLDSSEIVYWGILTKT